MEKFKDTEILTRQVYLNIESEERSEVETKGMTTQEAIAEYGELEVLVVGEPQYASESKATVPAGSPAGKHSKREADDHRRPGTTNVRLKAA